MSTLASSSRHADTPFTTRCYARYVTTFGYISYNRRADLLALPLLVEFLRFAVRLRHLRIDVISASVPLVLNALSRGSIICAPPPSFDHMYVSATSFSPWILPSLESIRSSKAAVVESLMRYRGIRTAVFDEALGSTDLHALLCMSPTLRGTHLLRLSISLSPSETYSRILRAIAVSFPSLTVLSIRIGKDRAEKAFNHVALMLMAEDYTLPALTSFGINHGFLHDYTRTLEPAQATVVQLAEEDNYISMHVLVFQLDDGHTRAMVSLTFLQITASKMNAGNPCPQLSVFEVFLLGSDKAIIDAFFALWTPDLVQKLRVLSSSTLMAIEAYASRSWDVEVFLSRWFPHPPSFLRTLDQCDAVISGSEAQQFFGRCEFRGRDLDIYVPFHGLLDMGNWLRSDGFVFQATADKHPLFDVAALLFMSYVGPAAAGVKPVYPSKTLPFGTFNFVRPVLPGASPTLVGRHVQLIAVPDDPVTFIISSFHSTGVMNYLSAKYAVSLFPHATFVKRKTFVCQDITRNSGSHHRWMKKYQRRGFEVVSAGMALPVHPEITAVKRHVGDHMTWVMPYARPVLEKTEGTAVNQICKIPFEVLPYYYEVAAAGAALRISPRFAYSALAIIANPDLHIAGYHSPEIVAAFTEYFGGEGGGYSGGEEDSDSDVSFLEDDDE
ncbi:hypothetical protein GY45DRAFT_1375209 [Cubamyces sp. BRFM 1775]|nr:hypothetical protein GY45DRAFT_1375209 [Cubamyces sp. BRFM 1775]